MFRLPRREFLGLCGGAAAAAFLPRPGLAALKRNVPLHGLSAFGNLKYGPDFQNFDYASPEAPTGGVFNFSPPNWAYNQNVETFNTLNTFVPNSDAPPRMELCFDSLMTGTLDEPDAIYGLLAESVTIAEDGNNYIFKLRPDARFSDDSPLTAEDIAFTYKLFREKAHPSLLLPLQFLSDAVAEGPSTVRLAFSGRQSDRTILSVATFPIVSKAFFTKNPFDGSQLNPPLGSGQYKVGRFSAGQSIDYVRRDDYWGKDLPVNRGLGHFGTIRIEFYRNREAGFEAFKKGNVFYREEFTSRVWATGYDFPAIQEKRVVKRTFPAEKIPSMQAWALNLRRPQFQDVRVRRAIGCCFDFEWTRRNLFYGSYERSESLFERSDFVASGRPSPAELKLLEPLRGKVPDEVFSEPYIQPVSDGSGHDRKLLRQAFTLLGQAGWTLDGRTLVNGRKDRLVLEILVNDNSLARVCQPFVDNMRTIGIGASIKLADSAQYQERQSKFDFDMIMMAANFSPTPTREALAHYFSSQAADTPSSYNLPGTKDPAIDSLIDTVGKVTSRDELITAMRVLDRVLRARGDWIPNWYLANHRTAFWDMFGFNEKKPDYGFPVETLWWFDEKKAQAIGKG